MWRQRLSSSGVATFHWQKQQNSPEPEHLPLSPLSTDRKGSMVHNPALAAIRASQQLQEFAAKEGMNGLDDGGGGGVQASIQALRELAAEQDRKFKQETPTNGSESSTPEQMQWPTPTPPSTSTTTTTTNGHPLKRRISQLSDSESALRSRVPPPP